MSRWLRRTVPFLFVLAILGCGGGEEAAPVVPTPIAESVSEGTFIGVPKAVDIIADDNNDAVFKRYGPTNCGSVGACWKQASNGYGGHMWWTWNNKVTTTNWGVWTPDLSCPGNYEVWAYIPSPNATTTAAKYTISYAGGTIDRTINQSGISNDWTHLTQFSGTRPFTKGTGGSVKLIDATGETLATKQIGFDAMKWVYKSALSSMTLTVKSPNGGEKWLKGGSCLNVTWNSANLGTDAVRIHLYKGGTSPGNFVKGLTNDTPNDGSECIPASSLDVTPGTDYYIGMSNVNANCDGVVWDFSDAGFSIVTPPTVNITFPNNGNTWQIFVTETDVQASCQTTDGTGIEQLKLTNSTAALGVIYSHTAYVGGGTTSTNVKFLSVPLDVGTNMVEVTCSAGAQGSDAMQIIMNNTIPVVTITTNGGANFTTSTTSTTVAGTCADLNKDIDAITYTNETTGWSYNDTSFSGGTANFSESIPLVEGSNAIKVVCTDTHGGSGQKGITITLNQTGGMTGTVYNSAGGVVSGATVGVVGPQEAYAATSPSGTYTFSGLKPGSYTAKASATDFNNSASVGVTITAGNTTQQNFTLTPKPKPVLDYTPTSISVTMDSGMIDGSQKVLVKNTGDADLTYSLGTLPSWLTVQRNGGANLLTGNAVSLSSGAQDTLRFLFNSNGVTSSQSAAVAINSNDGTAAGASVSVAMTLNALPPPPPPPAGQPAPATPAFIPKLYGQCVEQNACYADPVNTATGNYTYEQTDLKIVGRGFNLALTRSYNSRDATVGPLGFGWSHVFNAYLFEANDGTVYIRWGNGRTDVYTPNGGGTYTPPAGIFDNLVQASQFILTEKDRTEWTFYPIGQAHGGQLSQVKDRHENVLTLAYDAQDRLTQVTGPVGNNLTFAYVDATDMKIVSVTDPSGRIIQFTYSGDLLTQVTDPKGNAFHYTYDTGKRLTQIQERDGTVVVVNTYDADDRVINQQNGVGSVTTFAYDTPSAGKTTITNPLGQTEVFAYDALYRLTSHQAANGGMVTYLYNTENQRMVITDARGEVTSLTYDVNGNLTKMVDPTGAATSWTYDSGDQITGITSPLGQLTTYTYNTAGDLTSVSTTVSGVTGTWQYAYLATGEVSSVTDPEGAVTAYVYDAKGDLTQTTDPVAAVHTYASDALHRLTSHADPLGHVASYAYDANDNVTHITDPLGRQTTLSYDTRENLTSLASPSGTVSYVYDGAGRITQLTEPEGTTTFSYDALGRRTSVKTPDGTATSYDYNALGVLKQVTDPTGRTLTWTHDLMGNPTVSTGAAGGKTTVVYDGVGQPTSVTDPLGQSTALIYNAAGQVTKTTDPLGNIVQISYDGLGRTIKTTDPLQGATQYQYDKNSRLTKLTTPNGTAMTWSFDAAGRLIEEKAPSNAKRTVEYDAAGQTTSVTDANGAKITFAYDAAGRLTEVVSADAVKRTITYDDADRPTQITEGSSTRFYTYDSAGHITATTDPWGKVITYSYNTAGLCASMTYPGGKTVNYTYDAAGRMLTVTDWLGGVTTYSYDTAGRLSTVQYPNGNTTTRMYDTTSRVTSVVHKKANGAILAAHMVSYDAKGHVIASEVTPEPTTFLTPSDTAYTANVDAQYTQIGTMLLEHDPVGQLLSRTGSGSAQYTYDARQRLATVTASGATSTMTYGPEGERIALTTSAQTTKYVVDTTGEMPSVVAELDANGAATRYYVYGLELVASLPASGTDARYYHADANANVVALTDPAGEVTDSYFYHPFGKVLAKSGSTANPFQFAGTLGVQSDATGLLYMRARYYDPVQGRFIAKDPLGFLGRDLNPYTYVHNNPATYNDPKGLFFDIVLDIFFVAYDVYNLVTEPSWENAAALGLDAVAAVIPGVTGAGMVYKTMNAASKAEKVVAQGIKIEKAVTKTEKYLVNVAKEADKLNVVGKSDRVAGTLKHTEAKNIITKEMSNLKPEVTYKGSDVVAYGTKESVRPDVVRGPVKNPETLYDFKFGESGFSPKQVQKIQKEVGAPVPVIEIRPNGVIHHGMPSVMPKPFYLPKGLGAAYNLGKSIGNSANGPSAFTIGGGNVTVPVLQK